MLCYVGLSGYAGVGKDSIADYLQENLNNVSRRALADPIKRAAQAAFSWPNEILWGPSYRRNEPDPRFEFSGVCPTCKVPCALSAMPTIAETWLCKSCDETYPQYVTPRLILRIWGTEAGRALCPDIWINTLLAETQKLLRVQPHVYAHTRTFVVIPDIRYPNELDAIRDYAEASFLVRVKRPGVKRTSSHPSEAEMDKIPDSAFDLVVVNEEGCLDVAGKKVLDALTKSFPKWDYRRNKKKRRK